MCATNDWKCNEINWETTVKVSASVNTRLIIDIVEGQNQPEDVI